ncbi:MAG: PEP-CTERM sorting domain-containing protein, partial [Kiritimatiellia bacterium]
MNGSTFTSLLGGRDPQNEWSQYTVKNPDDGFAVAVKEEKTYAYSNKIASLNGVFDTGSNTSVTFVVFNWLTLDQNGALTMVTVDNLSENATVDLGTIARENTLTHTTISVMPVPEPTVFALLALGVAGFALRRKL